MSEYNNEQQNVYEFYSAPRLNQKKPYVTYALIAANLLMYIIMTVVGRIFDWNQNMQLFLFGAKVNVLIDMGQYWRLVTCMFLHAGMMHLLCNCYAIFVYGPIVEKFFGRVGFLVIYFIAGITGSLLSYMISPNAAVGASGAIFGLMGCLFYFRGKYPYLFKQIFGVRLFAVLAINLLIGFSQAGIDNYGHIGGFAGGYAAAFLTGLYKEDVSKKKRITIGAVMVLILTGCLAAKRIIIYGW